MKANATLGRDWGVSSICRRVANTAAQILVCRKHCSHLGKSSHDGHVHLDGQIAVKNAREHRHAVLGERVGQITSAAVSVCV